jgi:transcriptional regulator with XRE-family HTH domain
MRTGVQGRSRPRANIELFKLRLNAGLSANDLARRAQVSGNTVRAAERGDYIDERSQHAIATALEHEVVALFPLERQRPHRPRRAA